MLRDEIIDNWCKDIYGNLQRIKSVTAEYPAYTLISDTGYGVAIPIEFTHEVNEDFANAKLRTQQYMLSQSGKVEYFLTLTTNNDTDRRMFSSLCEQFVFPGAYGEFRKEIIGSPLKWWQDMKQIIGNKDSESSIYDTLGELWVYDFLIREGKKVTWNGPKGSTFDIESEDKMVEVKSTKVRSKKSITIHGKNQLIPLEGKTLDLYYCVFELSTNTGYSVNDIVFGLDNDGYDVREINRLLAGKGLEVGKSARDKKFILWNVYKYHVDERFPRITDGSFVDGKLPEGIESISYNVSLDGLSCESIYRRDKD